MVGAEEGHFTPRPQRSSAAQEGLPLELGPGPEEGGQAGLGPGKAVALGAGEGGVGWRSHRPGVTLQTSGRRSPEPCSKPEKILKRGAYDKVGAGGWGGLRQGWGLQWGGACDKAGAGVGRSL